MSRQFGWFTAGLASWFGAWGMQSVLFSWLVVGELHAGPEWVSVAQTSSMLPTLFLLLFGGLLADRLDPRKVLVRLQATAALPVLLLAAAVAGGGLRFAHLVAFGIGIGTLTAFTMPARDALLSRVAGVNLMHAVTVTTAVQFGAQALGALLAGFASRVGSVTMLCVQAALMLFGAAALSRLEPAPPRDLLGPRASALGDIAAGLREVAATPNLRAPLSLVLAVGSLFVGPFMVLFPLMVRDVYGGDIADLAVVLTMFPLGTIAGSLLMRARGGIRRKGLAALLALVFGALNLGAISTGLPFPGMIVATLFWGLAGSVFINCSRTLYQAAAPAAHRGRVLSVYQVGFMGGAPLGALLSGVVGQQIGTLDTLALFSAAMLLFVAVIWLTSDLATME